MAGHAITFGRAAPGIGVSDMARAIDFYRDVLGFAVGFQNGDPVMFTLLTRDSAELHLLLAPGHHGPGFNVAHLIVADVEGLYRVCVAAGAPIIKALTDKDHGMRAFVVADPDGNRLDIGQPN
jgi:catechol 2,3-dioxygenase-like lactoylglutathione lyase family enzyme